VAYRGGQGKTFVIFGVEWVMPQSVLELLNS
jgi:hypothetical protein